MRIKTKWHSFEVYPLNQIQLLNKAGIYTIWTKNYDDSFTILYVGETGDFDHRLDKSHHKFPDWVQNNRNGLYVHIYFMPIDQYSEDVRLATEQNLIKLYNPICNG